MPDTQYEDEYLLVLDGADEPVVADAILPELAALATVQSLANAARVVQAGNALVEKLQDASCDLRIQLVELAISLLGQFNLSGHASSSRFPEEGFCCGRRECPLRA